MNNSQIQLGFALKHLTHREVKLKENSHLQICQHSDIIFAAMAGVMKITFFSAAFDAFTLSVLTPNNIIDSQTKQGFHFSRRNW